MNPTKRFQRRIESFTCGNCGTLVNGNGYTNHCPECLWSRHVDINPGDRASNCNGMMEPIGLRPKSGTQQIVLRCISCGHERPNGLSPEDNQQVVVQLMAQPIV